MTRRTSSKVISGALSRRDILRAGGLLLPASAVVPGFFAGTSHAATAGGFDYYISTTGVDTNPGTLAAPWAITAINTKQSIYAGKRLGIVAGTYDVSSMMNPTNHTPVLNINGGVPGVPTYIASSDTSGNYSARAATLDAKGASGSYGGGNSNVSSIIGQSAGPNQGVNWGNWTLDGLKLTGFSLWAIHIGSYDGTGGPVPSAIIQNCEIFGGNAQSSTVASGVNLASIINYTSVNSLISNCYIHDNVGWNDNIHFVGILVWGLLTPTIGLTIQQCTLVNTGTIYGKSDPGPGSAMCGTTIQQCYIDMTSKTPSGGQVMGIEGFCNGAGTPLTLSVFRNNIIVGGNGMILECQEVSGADQWFGAMSCYNNTWVLGAGGQSGGNVGFRFWENSGLSRLFAFYNNLIYDNGVTSLSPYGYMDSNVDGFAVLDFNVYGTLNNFTTRGSGGSAATASTSQTFASWKAATGGDAHSIANSTNPFTNKGGLALQYQVQAGSPAYQAGRVGGVASGAVCNVGAWDGTVSNVGCNFSAGMKVPDSPVLNVS